jgi:TPR repeat protein
MKLTKSKLKQIIKEELQKTLLEQRSPWGGVSQDDVTAAKTSPRGANMQKANQLYKRACDNGDMRGCRNLGISYHYGTGVAKDQKKAKQLYKKACDGGDKRGCKYLTWQSSPEAAEVRSRCPWETEFDCQRAGKHERDERLSSPAPIGFVFDKTKQRDCQTLKAEERKDASKGYTPAAKRRNLEGMKCFSKHGAAQAAGADISEFIWDIPEPCQTWFMNEFWDRHGAPCHKRSYPNPEEGKFEYKPWFKPEGVKTRNI